MDDWQRTYDAAMDSVDLINAGKPEETSEEEWTDTLQRNVDHLQIILGMEWPPEFDLQPLQDAAGG